MPSNRPDLRAGIDKKIRADTEERFKKGSRQVKVESKADPQKIPLGHYKRELRIGDVSQKRPANIFGGSSGLKIFLALGLTIGLVNDFFDLAIWNKISLVSQTLDITAMFLVLFILAFAGKRMAVAVTIVFGVFVLEMLPIIGVVPWWTIGVLAWYGMTKRDKV